MWYLKVYIHLSLPTNIFSRKSQISKYKYLYAYSIHPIRLHIDIWNSGSSGINWCLYSLGQRKKSGWLSLKKTDC